MTKRTPELETAILTGFANGRPIGKLCREHGISRTTLHNWKHDDADFARRFDEARPSHAEAMMDEALRIADNPTSKWVELHVADATAADHFRHARLRIDTRLRIARMHLRTYEAFLLREDRFDREDAEAEQQLLRKHTAETPQFANYADVLNEAHRRIRAGEPPLRPNPHRDANGKLLVPLKSQRYAATPPARDNESGA